MHRSIVVGLMGLALLAAPGMSSAQSKGFIVADAGWQFGTEGFRQDAALASLPGSTLLVGYPVGYSGAFDIGGGYLFTPSFGVGATATYTSQPQLAAIAADVDIPGGAVIRLDPSAVEFDRSETGVHIQLVGVLPVDDRFTVTLYGGPSWIRVSQDVVSSISAPSFELGGGNVVLPQLRAQTENVDGWAWGFNVGADMAYYFNDTFGLGAGLRYTRATVEIEDVIGTAATGSPRVSETRAGGGQAVFGLRLRF